MGGWSLDHDGFLPDKQFEFLLDSDAIHGV